MFAKIKESLAVSDTDDLILRENLTNLTSIYQNIAVILAHAGQTKALLRSKINKDNINEELAKNIFAPKLHANEFLDKRHYAKNISLQVGDRVMIKQRKLKKLTPVFERTSYKVINTKGILTGIV